MNNLNTDSSCIVCGFHEAYKMGLLCRLCAKDPFKIEILRSKLSELKDFKNLKKTYISNLAEIEDLNTEHFWSRKLRGKSKHEDGSMAKDRISIILRKLKYIKGNLLDAGFGRGELEIKLQSRKDITIYGIDISEFAVKSAKEKLRGTFLVGNILNIPFPNKYFDMVIASEILEHIPPSKTFKALKELKRVLKQKGTLIITIPLNERLEDMVKSRQNLNAHVRVYTPKLIEAELKITGFKIRGKNFLFAFSNLYLLKKILQKTILLNRWQPNNMIIFAQK